MQRNYVIIVAGGAGTRIGGDVPKQFLPLNGMPVMMHAIHAFAASKSSPHVVVVIHPAMRPLWSSLCNQHQFSVTHTIADAGRTRFQSVKSGIDSIKHIEPDLQQSLIAVHDAARPLVTPSLIDCAYEMAARTGAAALATPSTNTVRIRSRYNLKNNTYPRELVYLMQTPQIFNGAILCEAYEQPEDETFTDDASVVEKKGYPITLVNGDTRNLKITFPEDLRIAELLLRQPV
jgi:2-C-methyl-D-erythritol 4-phosphate cytidylyltransferase